MTYMIRDTATTYKATLTDYDRAFHDNVLTAT